MRIVLGGTSVIDEMGRSVLRNFPQIDWCIDGEGEIPFARLLEALEQARDGFESKIPGLIYRRDNDVLVNPRKQLTDLTTLPDPDFDPYFEIVESYQKNGMRGLSPYLPVEVSRGCVHRCAYCGDHSYFTGHRHRPPAEIVRSVDRLTRRHKISSMFLVAEMMTPAYTDRLFDLLASRGHDHKIFCEIRNGMPKRNLSKMKRAGVYYVQSGIESFDTKLLKKMSKGTRCIDNLATMKHCEELGIKHGGNIIIGFPTETQSNVDACVKHIEYASTYRPPIDVIPFALIENCPVYTSPDRYGISKIDDAALWGKHLPPKISKDIRLWYKSFKQLRKKRNYNQLLRTCEAWKNNYFSSVVINGRPLLYYTDGGTFLRIEDYRADPVPTVLEDMARELYLFCDSIRNWQEIKKHFSENSPKALKRELNRLIDLKLMFEEENNYLGLAIKLNSSIFAAKGQA